LRSAIAPLFRAHAARALPNSIVSIRIIAMAKRTRAPARRAPARAHETKRPSSAGKTASKRRAAKTRRVKKAPPTPDPSPPFAARMGGGEKRLARRASARKKKVKRGVKSGTPSWRKFTYTPEFLADCRRRYEETPETVVSIALGYRMDDCTIRRLAQRMGWVRYRTPPRDVPRAVRLLTEVQALANSARRSDRHPEVLAESEPRSMAGTTGAVALRGSTSGRVPQGDGEDAALAGGGEPADVAATIERTLRDVRAELATIEAMRAHRKTHPQRPVDAAHTAATFARLTASLHELQLMSCRAKPGTNNDDDRPTDLDAYRDELARRIRAFVASRTGTGDADGAAGSGSVPGQ